MALVYVCNLDGLSDFERAVVGLLLAHDEAEESGLAGTVGADDAYNAVGRQSEREVFEEGLCAE